MVASRIAAWRILDGAHHRYAPAAHRSDRQPRDWFEDARRAASTPRASVPPNKRVAAGCHQERYENRASLGGGVGPHDLNAIGRQRGIHLVPTRVGIGHGGTLDVRVCQPEAKVVVDARRAPATREAELIGLAHRYSLRHAVIYRPPRRLSRWAAPRARSTHPLQQSLPKAPEAPST
jgi:hypothetical protein